MRWASLLREKVIELRLLVSFTERRLYWVDHGSEKLERADVDGKNREVISTHHNSADPFSVTVWDDKIYWTDW